MTGVYAAVAAVARTNLRRAGVSEACRRSKSVPRVVLQLLHARILIVLLVLNV